MTDDTRLKRRSFELAFQGQRQASDWTLVHGTITGPDDGPSRLVHAWLERDGRAYDPTVGRSFSVDVYSRIVGAVPAMRYSHETACRWVWQSGHTGPWDDCCLADEGTLRNDDDRGADLTD
jgi:hypothetical protein